MNLSEWNESYKYADDVCDNLKNKGYNTRAIPCSIYEEKSGMWMLVFNDEGKVFRRYAIKPHNNLFDMKNAIDKIEYRIITEC